MTEPNVSDWAGWAEDDAGRDAEAANEGGGGGFTYFKAKVGRNVVRCLPAMPGRKPVHVTHQHYVELPGRPKVVFNCPLAMKAEGVRCPVCEKRAKLLATGNSADRETAFGLAPRFRAYMCVVDREHPELGVQVYGFGKTVMKGLKSLRDDPDVGDFFRPGPDGFDVIIERTGTGKNDTEYSVRPAVKNTPLGDLSVIEAAPDLATLSRVPSEAEIRARLKGDNDEVKRIRDAERNAALPAGGAPSKTPAALPAGYDDAGF